MQIELSIIIVNWNSLAFLRKCIPSIYSDPGLENFEVIVVDNASHDGSEQFLKETYPGVKYVQSPANLGFAKANNLGYTFSRGKYLLFLNPDTEVLDHALVQMLGALRQMESAAIIGPRLLNTDGSLQTSCVQAFPTLLNQILDSEILREMAPRSHLWGTSALLRQGTTTAKVEMVSGACLMIRREVFEALGLFATDYFMYAEDVDLCYKASRAGWDIVYLPAAAVVHHGGGSTEGKLHSRFSAVLARESMLIFMKKYYGVPSALLFKAAAFVNALVRLFILSFLSFANIASHSTDGPLHKWRSVLRWSLGLEKWATELSLSSNDRPV